MYTEKTTLFNVGFKKVMMMWYATPRRYIIFRIIQILRENESIITEFNFPRKICARKHCKEYSELSSKLIIPGEKIQFPSILRLLYRKE